MLQLGSGEIEQTDYHGLTLATLSAVEFHEIDKLAC
jgi:hypothetical protein